MDIWCKSRICFDKYLTRFSNQGPTPILKLNCHIGQTKNKRKTCNMKYEISRETSGCNSAIAIFKSLKVSVSVFDFNFIMVSDPQVNNLLYGLAKKWKINPSLPRERKYKQDLFCHRKSEHKKKKLYLWYNTSVSFLKHILTSTSACRGPVQIMAALLKKCFRNKDGPKVIRTPHYDVKNSTKWNINVCLNLFVS